MKTFTGTLMGDLVALSQAVASHNYPAEFTTPEELRAYLHDQVRGTCQAGECFDVAAVADVRTSLAYCGGCWNLKEFIRKLDIQ